MAMLNRLKARLYFAVAWYFRAWAQLKLSRWSPRVIVVTGSAGKTTLLHLIEAQLGKEAHYSHHANSSFGIPFDILGMHGVTDSRLDWFKLFILAPIKAFTSPYSQKIYVAEADVDRPYEGKFLASLLKPEVTLWVSALHTHVAQFDSMVGKKFKTGEEAVAHEYGHFAAATKKLLVIDGNNQLMVQESARTNATVQKILKENLLDYKLTSPSTLFGFGAKKYHLPVLMPQAVYYQIAMTDCLLEYLAKVPDYDYKQFQLPPGRSSVLRGIKNTTIIDSTYNNSNIDTLKTMVELFAAYPAEHKWLVLGDMLEQGGDEAREHIKIAEVLNSLKAERIILVGPRIIKHAVPGLSEELRTSTTIAAFTQPKEVYSYLLSELQGGETIMFKGVRYLEGVIEKLLADQADASQLVRRGRMWDKRRREWGL